MNLTTLLIYIGIAGLILTVITSLILKKKENVLISYLQNFTGALFIFSGWVKAADPLGTAYKMGEYFTEFVDTFEPTYFSFLNPMFDWMNGESVLIAVIMIVFEIVLGVMLIIGALPKLTSWLFFLLVLFFTVLTGFTFTTGYVPEGVNYFDFTNWVSHQETNMKVTDCGCFGDFIKLKPFTSFMKDVGLLVPAIIFLIWNFKFHKLFNKGLRTTLLTISTVGFLLYCLSNYYWDIPSIDFRAFHEGKDVRATKLAEDEAQANVDILAFKLTNKSSGEKIELEYNDYISNYKKYPKTEWSSEQILSAPTLEPTKISDFAIEDFEDNDVTDFYLDPEGGYRFMIVSYYMKGGIKAADNEGSSEETVYEYEKSFESDYVDKIKPLAEAAKKLNIPTDMVVGGTTVDQINDFQKKYGISMNYHKADDILLKTIIRSNPGVVLWKNGTILKKWHIKKLPNFEEIKKKYIQQ